MRDLRFAALETVGGDFSVLNSPLDTFLAPNLTTVEGFMLIQARLHVCLHVCVSVCCVFAVSVRDVRFLSLANLQGNSGLHHLDFVLLDDVQGSLTIQVLACSTAG